jgi:2-hydroxychromene-2-carboxylate isomerase
MPAVIDYYFAPLSPWAYLGHDRLFRLARVHGIDIAVRPVDLAANIFPHSGGVPLEQRSAQRRAYRLADLNRFRRFLNIPLTLEPRYFPVSGDAAARLIVSVALRNGWVPAMTLTACLMRAVWVHDQDVSDLGVLASALGESGLDAALLSQLGSAEVATQYLANDDLANRAGVFGAPSYVFAGEIFWGQDRLDFLERAIRQALPPRSDGDCF